MIWPRAIRFIHWGLALFVILNQFVLESGENLHEWVGYSALALVLVRVALGFFGSGPSAFKNFPLQFASMKTFWKGIRSRKPDEFSEGHNPMASYIYLLIWFNVTLLALSGWLMGLDRFWGNENLERAHELFSNLLLMLIFFHLAGLLFDSIKFKRKSWLSMINGKRKRDL